MAPKGSGPGRLQAGRTAVISWATQPMPVPMHGWIMHVRG